MKCPYCSNIIADDSETCSFCGEKLTETCPYCKEKVSILDTECPHCNANIRHKENLCIIDIVTYVLMAINIIFTVLYTQHIQAIIKYAKASDSLSDIIAMPVAIFTICAIPTLVGMFKMYKIRKFGICLCLNFLLCIINIVACALTII